MSPEARAAALLFSAHATTVSHAIRDCVSGRELAARGFEADVATALQVDVSAQVPVLIDGAFAGR
jgi:2-phosphosulfolactate phosphatase